MKITRRQLKKVIYEFLTDTNHIIQESMPNEGLSAEMLQDLIDRGMLKIDSDVDISNGLTAAEIDQLGSQGKIVVDMSSIQKTASDMVDDTIRHQGREAGKSEEKIRQIIREMLLKEAVGDWWDPRGSPLDLRGTDWFGADFELGITTRATGGRVDVRHPSISDIFPSSERVPPPLQEFIIRSLVRRIISEKSLAGYHPDESYEEGTIEKLMLDKETSHGGWPERPSKSFTSDEPVNKQIIKWLKDMGMVKK